MQIFVAVSLNIEVCETQNTGGTETTVSFSPLKPAGVRGGPDEAALVHSLGV